MYEKGSCVAKCSEGSPGGWLTSMLSRHGCPTCFEPLLSVRGYIWFPVSGSPRSRSGSCSAPGSPGSPLKHRCTYRLRRLAECMSEQVLHDISGPLLFTQKGNHERFHIPTNKPGDSLMWGGLFHTYLTEGKRGTYLVLTSKEFIDPPPGDFWPKSPSLCCLQ